MGDSPGGFDRALLAGEGPGLFFDSQAFGIGKDLEHGLSGSFSVDPKLGGTG